MSTPTLARAFRVNGMAQSKDKGWKSLPNFFSTDVATALAFLGVVTTYLVPYAISGVSISHLISMLLIVACAPVVLRRQSREATLVFIIFTGIFIAGAFSGMALGPGPRFWSDLTKQSIIFLVAFFAGLSLQRDELYAILRYTPWLCTLFIVGVFALSGNPFSYGGRLALEGFVSSNVLGYIIVLAIAVLLAPPKRSWVEVVLCGVLLAMMLMTLSRSALLATLAIFWVRLGLVRGLFIVIPSAASLGAYFLNNQMIQRMLIVEDIVTSGGSGRFDLWHYLLHRYFTTPEAWLFGFGPGAIHRRLNLLTVQESAHSVVIDMLYFYGLAGLLLILATAAATWLSLKQAPKNQERTLARDIILITTVNGLVDISFDAAGINVLSALYFAFVVATLRSHTDGARPIWRTALKQCRTQQM